MNTKKGLTYGFVEEGNTFDLPHPAEPGRHALIDILDAKIKVFWKACSRIC